MNGDEQWIPKEIKRYIAGKSYEKDLVGKSEGTVLLFDDMVLKVEAEMPGVLETVRMM